MTIAAAVVAGGGGEVGFCFSFGWKRARRRDRSGTLGKARKAISVPDDKTSNMRWVNIKIHIKCVRDSGAIITILLVYIGSFIREKCFKLRTSRTGNQIPLHFAFISDPLHFTFISELH
jgi:hypothetical protein